MRPAYTTIFLVVVIAFMVVSLNNLGTPTFPKFPRSISKNPPIIPPTTITAALPFVYTFNTDGTLQEAGAPEESSSPYWWLNSGGKLFFTQKVGQTIQGDLPLYDKWRLLYAITNPNDTDGGLHPQNLFRLVTKSVADNMAVESLFKIERDNLSDSTNRNASNGLLLMSRYVDSNNLYYAGLRVDGTAIIKKKYAGTYYTLAQKKIYSGIYNRLSNPNLIPHRQWIALRVENFINSDNSLTIQLLMKCPSQTSSWCVVLKAIDDGKSYGSIPTIASTARSGIRTDFMDVTFESFKMEAI